MATELILSPYEGLAPLYDSDRNRPFYQSVAAKLVQAAKASPHDPKEKGSHQTWLDLGCGTGLSLLEFRSEWPEARWLGVDASPAMLHQARQKPELRGVHWISARAEHLPLPDACLDGVTSSFALHWFPEAAWTEIARVLKPGGFFFGSAPLLGRGLGASGNRALARELLRARPGRSLAQGYRLEQLREQFERGPWELQTLTEIQENEVFANAQAWQETLVSRGAWQASLGQGTAPELPLAGTPIEFSWKIGLFLARKATKT
jgi:ubiquinone/menaquinone biosynthesis C-methylase UbiE